MQGLVKKDGIELETRVLTSTARKHTKSKAKASRRQEIDVETTNQKNRYPRSSSKEGGYGKITMEPSVPPQPPSPPQKPPRQ
jgi:hypothetical protein